MNRFGRGRRENQRIRTEDALKHLLDCDESGRRATVESLAGAMGLARGRAAALLGVLRAEGLALAEGDGHRLTADGRRDALQVVRKHRLYETWLARETTVPPERWHAEAQKAEHHLDTSAVDELARKLGHPRFDPHGDPIPTREGELPRRPRASLASWPENAPAVIEHLEDEPAACFREAEKLGLAPGTRIDEPRHGGYGSIHCRVEGRHIEVPAAVAVLVHVRAPERDEQAPEDVFRLSELPVGGAAVVHALAPSCTGLERKRLLDLGLVPDTAIRCEFASPFGSPRSYDVRGALIALRRNQAERILVRPAS
ncbi:MAG: DNA-binding protein [Verrucomicrobia bacterium]|nr:DNA-binding protein [Verrucomicrobiota bacterium]